MCVGEKEAKKQRTMLGSAEVGEKESLADRKRSMEVFWTEEMILKIN